MTLIEIDRQGTIEGIQVPLGKFSQSESSNCTASNVTAYLGIPFAQPPLGSLRWKRPQRPAPSWKSSTARKSEWKCDPVQDLRLPEFFSKPRRDIELDEDGEGTISEDCLYLNIWVPNGVTKNNNSKAAVLAWVYGGSFIFGSPSQPGYDGARLCNESGCIVVTIAYRVGVFGFLASRELANQTPKEGTGNYGAWDVVAGLEWIQENIKSFGGDASNVTAFGESAGSILLHYLLLSPETPPNLFARVILESGTAISVSPRSMPSAQATFDAILEKLGVAASATELEKIQSLYNASADDLLTIPSTFPGLRPRTEYSIDVSDGRPERRMTHDQSKLNIQPQSLFGPVWDGVLVASDFIQTAIRGLPPSEQLRNGQKGILLGYCADEGTVFNMAVQSAQSLKRHASGLHPAIRSSVKQLYGVDKVEKGEDVFAACSGYSGDLLFQVPIRSLMLQLAKQIDVPAYGYIFAHRPSRELNLATAKTSGGADLLQKFGAMHSAELAYVFGFDGTEARVFEREHYPGKESSKTIRNEKLGFTVEEQELSLWMMRSFGKFAQQKTPWTALNHRPSSSTSSSFPESEEDCQLVTIGRFAALGSNTPLSIAAANDIKSGIPIREQKLGESLAWTEKVGPINAIDSIGSHKERQSFWAKDGFKNILLHYYGDEKMKMLP